MQQHRKGEKCGRFAAKIVFILKYLYLWEPYRILKIKRYGS